LAIDNWTRRGEKSAFRVAGSTTLEEDRVAAHAYLRTTPPRLELNDAKILFAGF
jgi:hypothetical protein